MLVKDRCSVKKSGQEPSMIVGKGSLYNKQTKTIAELLRCIPITSTSHTQIHHINKNLDLECVDACLIIFNKKYIEALRRK